MEEEKYLCFVKYVGEDIDETNRYEFLFTSNIEEFWGENFEYMPAGLCNELIPDKEAYDTVKILRTSLKLDLVQKSCCHSFQDAVDGVIAIAWENMNDYDEYPEEGRAVFHYGDSLSDVEEILLAKGDVLEDNGLDTAQ